MTSQTATATTNAPTAVDSEQTTTIDPAIAGAKGLIALFLVSANALAFFIVQNVGKPLRKVATGKIASKSVKSSFDKILSDMATMLQSADYKKRVVESISSTLQTLNDYIGDNSAERLVEVAYVLGALPKSRMKIIDEQIEAGTRAAFEIRYDALGMAILKQILGGAVKSRMPDAAERSVSELLESTDLIDTIKDEMVIVEKIGKHIAAIGKRNIPVGPMPNGISIATTYDYIMLATNTFPTKLQRASHLAYAAANHQ